MREKNKGTVFPSLFSAYFLVLVFLGFGCGGVEPTVRESIAPEKKTAPSGPLPSQALKRTHSPDPTPPERKSSNPTETALTQETEPSPPSQAETLSATGESAYRQEDYKFAEKNFREALSLEPKLLHALTGLGWTLYDSDRPDEAFFFFRRANAHYPESGSARRGLAYLLYRYGRMKEAKALLGSLNKTRWPELTNIENELKARAIKGLPAPRLPTEKSDEKSEEAPSARAPSEPQELSPEPKSQQKAEQDTAPEKELHTDTAKRMPPDPTPGTLKPPPAPVTPAPPPISKPSLEGMVSIPGGRFMMGVEFSNPNRFRRRWRRRRVTLRASGGRLVEVTSFRLDKFEVTNALYEDFVLATSGPEPPFWRKVHFTGPHLPVVGITWDEARAYCAWAGKRLPTEAEWEYAAQGAGKGRRYPWGNAQRDRNAVFGLSPDAGGPKAVGRRPEGASVHGVEDMAGNVWEWVEDEFRTKPEDAQPIRRNGRELRTLKGGSWVNGWWALTSSHRTGDFPDRRLPAYGFRCAADAPE
ncbi:MAG: SUMF1/EgtB/PvdO family nonheme iron enzyme [Nitrospinae bacterium]|nr:SUMF1/EgtB/PvdO family nonheme iron enzyme [Nitrospinota bacterium]